MSEKLKSAPTQELDLKQRFIYLWIFFVHFSILNAIQISPQIIITNQGTKEQTNIRTNEQTNE